MKTTDFNSQPTSKQLNETMFKRFGTKVNFEKYTREQLEDYRNLLRTKINQTEGTAGYNELLSNEGYQKDKHLLDLLNTRIKEMLGESKSKPDFLDLDKDGNKTEPMKKAADEADVDESGLQAYLGKKKYGKKGMKALQNAGRKGASKEKMAKLRAKYDKLDEKAVSKAQQRAAGIALAAKRSGKKPTAGTASAAMVGMSTKELEKFAGTKHKGLPKKIKETMPLNRHEVDSEAGVVTQKDESNGSVSPSTQRAIDARKAAVKKAQSELDAQTLRPPRPEQTADQATAARIARQKEIAQQIYKQEKAERDAAANARRPAGTPPVRPIKLTRENDMNTNEAKKAKPDYLDLDKDGNKTEPMKAAAASMRKKTTKGGPFGKAKAKPTKPKKDTENPFSKGKGPKEPKDNTKGKNPFAKGKKKSVKEDRAVQYKIIIEGLKRFIAEDEEGKAKDITAGSDMVNDFTSWMQRVGQYQTKSMIELADSIRSNFGPQEADAFKNAIQPALQSSLEALTASREVITKAVAVLAGEESAEVPMGTGQEIAPPESETDTMNVPAKVGVEDEFAASDAATGGRETRESKQFKQLRKIDEAHSLMRKLAG